MSSAPIRILVADDHPVVRDGLIAVLNTQPDFQVVGEAGTGLAALEKAIALQPDVILLDLEMPELNGAEVIHRLRQSNPAVRAIVFTAFDTDERILGAVQAGAQGYLLKGAPRDEIFRAIRVVSEGGSLLQPIVASKLLRQVSGRGSATSGKAAETLTPREMEVLHLLAQGKTNGEIAAGLVITERTVKFHVGSILRKLGAGNRTEAVAIAAQQGLITL
ncbi:MAG: response regulator transcription factor [Chloroflexi bacterium]|nr:response regulator transcription factor [Chloroflexota bacterium]